MAETNTETQEQQTPDLVSTTQETTTGTIVETQKPEVPMPDPTASEDTPQEEAEKPQDSAAEVEQEFANQKQTDETIKKELTAKGLDFDALADEYDKTGSLSADSLAALEKAGYPKQMVDAYLAGLDAMADRFVGEVVKMAGGEDSYKALAQYLQTQPKNVIDGFNAALQSGSMAQIQLAIGGIQAAMTKQYGTANPSVMAGQQGRGAAQGYQTTAEMTKDMSDPRYQTDPAFTKEVYRKLQNSSIF